MLSFQVDHGIAVVIATAFTLSLFCTFVIADEMPVDKEMKFDDCEQIVNALPTPHDLECVSFFPTHDDLGLCTVGSFGDRCYLNPCKNGGTCRNIETSSFDCDCIYPYGGDRCEELDCDNKCFRDKDLILFVDMSKPMSWDEAYAYCEDKGLTMFMDKDWDLHGFAFGVFSELTPDREAEIGFYIGLNKTGDDPEWTYVDGTLLSSLPDQYQNWAVGYPDSSSMYCVQMQNTKRFMYRWVNQYCGTPPVWNYYPVCQKRYPNLLQ